MTKNSFVAEVTFKVWCCAIRHLFRWKLELYLFPCFTFGEAKILIENQNLKVSFFGCHKLGFKVWKNGTLY